MSNSWPTKKLGELCEIKIGKTPRRGVIKYWTNGTLPWATIAEVRGAKITNTNEKIRETAAKELNMTPFPKGTILYTFKLSIGRVGIAGVDLFTNEAIAGFFIKNEKNLMSEWLFYVLPLVDYKPFLSNAVKGNTLNRSSLNLLPIPLPPLAIQKQIVERMDKIAEAQKLNDLQISKTEELYESLVNKEIKSNKYKEVSLSEVVKPQETIDPRRTPNEEYQYIDISSVDSDNFAVRPEGIKSFKGKDAPSRARKRIQQGDIIFSTVRPNLEKIAVIDFPTYNSLASTGFAVLRPDETKVNPNYMGTVTCSGIVTKQVLPYVRGAAYPAVSDRDIFNSQIPLPDRKKQDEISQKFIAVQEYKKKLLKEKTLLKELFDSVLARSMKGKV